MRTRMVSRRAFLRTSALATAAGILAGCGATPAPTASPAAAETPAPTVAPATAETPVPTATSAAAATPEPVATEAPVVPTDTPAPAAAAGGWQGEFDLWDWDFGPRNQAIETMIGEWEETHPGVTINYVPMGWTDIETKVLASASGGTGPGCSFVNWHWRFDLQRGGVLAAYPEELFDWSDLLSTPYLRAIDGHIYTSVVGHYTDQLYYNRELLAAEGIEETEIPADWDSLMAMAQQLTKQDSSGKITQAGFAINDFWAQQDIWFDLVYQQGGWLFTEDGAHPLWNEEAGVRAAKFLQDIYHTWKVDDPEFLGKNDAFGNGQAAFTMDGGYMGPYFKESFPQIANKWATAPQQTLTGKPLPAWGIVFPEEWICVFNDFPHEMKTLEFDFIKYTFASDEKRLQWASIMGAPTDSKHLLDHPQITGDNIIATQAVTLPYRVNYGDYPWDTEKVHRSWFDQLILENADPKATADAANEQADQIMTESGKKRYITEREYNPPSA